MAEPTTKAELLAQVRAAGETAEATIARVPVTRFGEPGPNGDWSAKDEFAHLTYWNEILLARLRAAAAGTPPDPSAFVHSDAEIDERNARCFIEHRDEPLDDVLAAFRASHAAVAEAIAALTDADLFDARRFPWTEGRPLWDWVAGNITDHYPEHLDQITDWLARSSLPA